MVAQITPSMASVFKGMLSSSPGEKQMLARGNKIDHVIPRYHYFI